MFYKLSGVASQEQTLSKQAVEYFLEDYLYKMCTIVDSEKIHQKWATMVATRKKTEWLMIVYTFLQLECCTKEVLHIQK